MQDINTISSTDFKDENLIVNFENELRDIIISDDIVGASNYYNNLEKIIAKNNNQFTENKIRLRYDKIIDISKWVALTSINNIQEIARIINSNIIFLLKNEDIDLWNKLEQKLRSILILEDRDELKKVIKDSLLKNDSILTGKSLFLGDNEVKGSIANWLKYYNSIFLENYISNLRLQEFINSDKNIRNLDSRDKEYISKLFYFFIKLKQSSFSFEGIEDYIYVDDGRNKGWIKLGDFIPLKSIEQNKQAINYGRQILKKALGKDYENFFPSENVDKNYKKEIRFVESENKLLNNYKIVKFDWQKVVLEADNLVDYNKKTLEFKNSFHQAINDKNNIILIAHLLILAKNGYLDEIFERDDKIKEIFKKHLAKKFSEKIADHFAKNLREPVYLSYFLQHILKDILKLDDNESAVLAIKLVNELKRAGDKQYLPIAYGDLKAGVFKWKGIIEKDDRLELAD